MLKITKEALERLHQTLKETAETVTHCLRVVIGDDGPELIVDIKRPGDETLFTSNGRLLLVMDKETFQFFNGKILTVNAVTNLLVFT